MEKREIKDYQKYYEKSLEKLNKSKHVSPFNKKLITKFLDDCELGKTINAKRKKKISVGRRTKIIYSLGFFCRNIKKDFNKVANKDMEKFILDLEKDKLKKQNGEKFSEPSKLDFKNVIRKFYKWYLGDNDTYPKLVSWIDTNEEKKIPEFLKLEEVNKLCKETDILNACLIKVLFDSGFRIDEAMNIRLRDIEKVENEDGHYYNITINFSKTEPRTISLDLATFELENWLKIHPDKDNKEAYLFPLNYDAIRMRFLRLGKKVLGKRLYPHLLRKSSATYYAQHLGHHEICYRYGWSFSSDCPDLYISRSGMKEQRVIEKIRYSDRMQVEKKMDRIDKDNNKLKTDVEVLQRREDKTYNFLVKVMLKSSDKNQRELAKAIIKKDKEFTINDHYITTSKGKKVLVTSKSYGGNEDVEEEVLEPMENAVDEEDYLKSKRK